MHGPLSQPFSEVAPIKMKVIAIIGTSGSFFLNQISESKQYWKTIMNTYVDIYTIWESPFPRDMKSLGFINSKEWCGDSHYIYLPLFVHYYMAMVDWWYSFFYELFTGACPLATQYPPVHITTNPSRGCWLSNFHRETLVLWISHAWFWQ